jgi:hypothetical protein
MWDKTLLVGGLLYKTLTAFIQNTFLFFLITELNPDVLKKQNFHHEKNTQYFLYCQKHCTFAASLLKAQTRVLNYFSPLTSK